MGTCWNCQTQVTLTPEQTKCDNCGEILVYRCNNCKEEFLVEDKEHKLKECKLCGYFYCPHCGVCSWKCKKYNWQTEIMKILAPEFSFMKYPVLEDKIKRIISYLENEKVSNERKECIRNVPITYAKGRIKSLLFRSEGFGIKNENDRQAFVKRMNEIGTVDIGTKLTISKIRENGSYGQEYRDAFNLLVCLGKLKITWQINKDGIEYALYERVEEAPCQFLAREDLVINECPRCKEKYPRGIEFCDKCIKKSGKNKGEPFKLKERRNNCDTCQMYRGDFT